MTHQTIWVFDQSLNSYFQNENRVREFPRPKIRISEIQCNPRFSCSKSFTRVEFVRIVRDPCFLLGISAVIFDLPNLD